MSDPGLPPRPPSLNLLASLVKEEESKENVFLPNAQDRTMTKSQEFYDAEKHSLMRETSSSSFKEFKMKGENIPNPNTNTGFKGKKISKPRSNSSDNGVKDKRPFSADYNQYKRNKINGSKPSKRPKTTKGGRGQKGRGSPAVGQRPRSPHMYSSDTSYSSDPEYITKTTKKGTDTSNHVNKGRVERDSFFDSDGDNTKDRPDSQGKDRTDTDSFFDIDTGSNNHKDRDVKTNGSANRREQGSHNSRKVSSSDDGSGNDRRERKEYVSSDSTSDTYTSDEDDRNERSGKQNGHYPRPRKQRNAKTVHVNRHGEQRNNENSDERMVVVEDESSSMSSSSDEEQPVRKQSTPKPKNAPLLKRKKKQNLKLLHISPDKYLETKLHQKYCELDELMNCSFVDQRSHVTRYHLYQMELLNSQYQNVSHGVNSAGVIIPRSLPGDIRQRNARPSSAVRPGSAKRLNLAKRPSSAKTYYYKEGEIETNDDAYGTIRSVMVAEHARTTNKIRTDIHADRPPSGKKTTKKKKTKINVTLKTGESGEEEEDISVSEKPSIGSRGSSSSRSLSQHDTPRSGPSIDHHIKYTDNEKLKKWLKEKDKLYRKQVREERKKKKKEREQLISEANEKLERRIKSQKEVKRWMSDKDKELRKKHKEEDVKIAQDLDRLRKMEVNLPGDALQIRPQSAPSTGRSDDIRVDKEKLQGGKTPEYVRNQLHLKKEIDEENKQAKRAYQKDPHPPQTKFIYKRPVAGKIKFRMEVRGKSPIPKEQTDKKDSEEDKSKQMRLSYDDWIKKKRTDDAAKKYLKDAERKKELAKSDPELDRMIPDIAKKRIEDKLNSRKRVNSGIKKFDEKANKSFGGSEFNSDLDTEPKNPYRLEGDIRGNKQTKRPSTAPASRGSVPHPTKSANSPRKAVIPQKVDKVMSNNDTSNPYSIPFPPEKGIPEHVASRQRKIFADRVTENLNEIEQRALMNSELIKEGLSEYTEGYNVSQGNADETQTAGTLEQEEDKRPSINEMMYSPRKREDSSESSDEERKAPEGILDSEDQITVVGKAKETITDAETSKVDSPRATIDDQTGENATIDDAKDSEKKPETTQDEIKETCNNDLNEANENVKSNNVDDSHDDAIPESVEMSMYRSFDNLNTLTITETKLDQSGLDTSSKDSQNNETASGNGNGFDLEAGSQSSSELAQVSYVSKIKVISDNELNQSLTGILKESRKSDEIPVPESSGEPSQSGQTQKEDHEETTLSPRQESESPNRKRVSFNDKTEVFQSFDSTSSSTNTITPEPSEFNAEWESLEAYPDEPEEELEKVSFNIAGFELKPVIINEDNDKSDEGETEDGGTGEDKADEENKTFITNPDDTNS